MSEFTNRIDTLLTNTHQKRADLCRGTGLPESTIRGWIRENKVPNLEAVMKIANFFNCSIEYLATGKEAAKTEPQQEAVPQKQLSDDEQNLVDYFRLLDSRDREFLLMTAKNLSDRATEEKKKSVAK